MLMWLKQLPSWLSMFTLKAYSPEDPTQLDIRRLESFSETLGHILHWFWHHQWNHSQSAAGMYYGKTGERSLARSSKRYMQDPGRCTGCPQIHSCYTCGTRRTTIRFGYDEEGSWWTIGHVCCTRTRQSRDNVHRALFKLPDSCDRRSLIHRRCTSKWNCRLGHPPWGP